MILGLVRLSPTLFPQLQPIADALQKERRVLLPVTLVLFVGANLQIYDRAQCEIRRATTRPPTIDWRSLPTFIERQKPGDIWLNSGIISIVKL